MVNTIGLTYLYVWRILLPISLLSCVLPFPNIFLIPIIIICLFVYFPFFVHLLFLGGYRTGLLGKVVWRTAKLFLLGLLTQGGNFPEVQGGGYDLKRLRIPGILQRIAWAYFVVAMMAMYDVVPICDSTPN